MPTKKDTTEPAKTGELVPAGETALATNNLPDFIPALAPEELSGAEGMTKEDIQMPRLAIAQAMSPQKMEGKPEFIDGLKLGDLFNTLNSDIYGKGPLEFAIVRREPSRWMEFDADRNIVDRNVHPNDPRTLWRKDPTDPTGKKQLPPIATEFRDYIIILLDQLMPVVISCSKTNIPAAKKLNGLIQFRSFGPHKVPLYARRFSVETAMTSNEKGTWGVFVFKNVGTPGVPNSDLIQNREVFEFVRNVHESLQDTVVHYDVAVEPVPGDDTSFDTAKMEKENERPGGM